MKTRREVLEQAYNECLFEMYRRAQPSVNLQEYIDKIESGELSKDSRIYEWHYLPNEVMKQIFDDCVHAYSAEDHFRKTLEFLLEDFKEGGYRTVFKDVFNTGEQTRTAEKTETLPELIGEENAEKVYALINDFLGFYHTNTEYFMLVGLIMQAPTSNREVVEKKWGIEIDDSVYKNRDGNWDYTYYDYIDGEQQITDEDYGD